jgi:hypothetical protein
MSTQQAEFRDRSDGALPLVLLMASCGGDPNSPGVEYMPDMYRSPAMEAYVDYRSGSVSLRRGTCQGAAQRQSARLSLWPVPSLQQRSDEGAVQHAVSLSPEHRKVMKQPVFS